MSEVAIALAETRKPWIGKIWCLPKDLPKLKKLGIAFGKRGMGKHYYVCVIPFEALNHLGKLARQHAGIDGRFTYDILPTGTLGQVMRV